VRCPFAEERLLFCALTILGFLFVIESISQITVHVLIPTKRPAHLDPCILSLTLNADLAFASLWFHFGVDWDDNDTIELVTRRANYHNITFTVHRVFGRKGDVSTIVNFMFASVQGQGYFVRFNDDTLMMTKDWNKKCIVALRNGKPANVGVAALRDNRHASLQTHSFVSWLHKDIFGFYFPPHFKNWYEDDWITAVYRNFTWPSDVELQHLWSGPSSERYAIHRLPDDAMRTIVQESIAKIDEFLGRTKSVRCC
jgi:hypothetical protein